MTDVVMLADGEEDEEKPTYEQLAAVVGAVGLRAEYNNATGTCCGGEDWCGLLDPGCPVEEGEGTYTKAVLGVMNLFNRVNQGIATFLLNAPTLYRHRIKVGQVVVGGRRRVAALRRCVKQTPRAR